MRDEESERKNECDNIQKFLALEEEKRERIINAAVKEFLAGYKKASTDAIVREAGISKGLLFHYFGTKERLYSFLVDYCIETIKREYIDLINAEQPDMLDSIWQMSLLKRDISVHHPDLFEFMTSAYIEIKTKGGSISENLARVMQMREDALAKIYANADKSLFRDDVAPQMTMDIINWTMFGYAHSKIAEVGDDNPGAVAREKYETYLEEFQKLLDVLRLCFYKQQRANGAVPQRSKGSVGGIHSRRSGEACSDEVGAAQAAGRPASKA